MPQGPLAVQDRANATAPVYGITLTTGTAIKTVPARVVRCIVVACASSVGAIYDCANVASTAAGNKVFTVPATVGMYTLEWPCTSGVTVFAGVGMTLSVSLS